MPRSSEIDPVATPDAVTDPALLAARVDGVLPAGHATTKRMFGGITFLVNGNMLCCASKTGLMVRVGAEAEDEALASPFAQPCLNAGRRMPGFVMIAPAGLASDAELRGWVARARAYVDPMPPKLPARRPASRAGRG